MKRTDEVEAVLDEVESFYGGSSLSGELRRRGRVWSARAAFGGRCTARPAAASRASHVVEACWGVGAGAVGWASEDGGGKLG